MEKLATGGLGQALPRFSEVARELGIEVLEITDFQAQREALEQAPPVCFLVDCATAEGSQILAGARGSAVLVDIPAVAVVQQPWSPGLRRVFGAGADDFLPVGADAQLRRVLHAFRHGGETPAHDTSTMVVLADPDRERRISLSRSMRRMGMDVRFVLSGNEIPRDGNVKLVVSHSGLPPDGAAAALQAHRKDLGGDVPWVLVGTLDELEIAREQLGELPLVRYMDLNLDPAQIVPLINQLLTQQVVSKRRSVRLPYEAPLRLDITDSWRDVWCYLFNISLGGVFARTLTPPPLSARVQMEFCPPASVERISMSGTVVWRQEFAGNKAHPPGVGVQFDDEQAEGAPDRLQAGYMKLFEELDNPVRGGALPL